MQPWIRALQDPKVRTWLEARPVKWRYCGARQKAKWPAYLGNRTQLAKSLGVWRVGRVLGSSGHFFARDEKHVQTIHHYSTCMILTTQDEEDYPLLEIHWNEAHGFIQKAPLSKRSRAWSTASQDGIVAYRLWRPTAWLVYKNLCLIQYAIFRKQRGNMALCDQGGFQEQLVTIAQQHDLASRRGSIWLAFHNTRRFG